MSEQSARSSALIAVAGDHSAARVAATLRERGFEVTEELVAFESTPIAIVAADATAGVRDVHRQIAEKIAGNSDVRILWLWTQMSQIDDRELMDLQRMEAQQLLEDHGVSGPNVRFAVDTEQTTVSPDTLKGWTAVEGFLKTDSSL